MRAAVLTLWHPPPARLLAGAQMLHLPMMPSLAAQRAPPVEASSISGAGELELSAQQEALLRKRWKMLVSGSSSCSLCVPRALTLVCAHASHAFSCCSWPGPPRWQGLQAGGGC